MLIIKALTIALCCTAATIATSFKPCDDGEPPKSLRVQGCEEQPCTLYRGETIAAEWDFSVVKNAEKLKPRILATALGVTQPYPFPEQDACKSLTNGVCPLNEGEVVTYGLNMPVLKWYPKVKVLLEFSILDESSNVHVCFKINTQVADR